MYQTDLTETEWQYITKVLNLQERKQKYDLRMIWNAIFYLVKTGCQWRMLPLDFHKWQLVYYYYRKWASLLDFDLLLEKLRGAKGHSSAGRKTLPYTKVSILICWRKCSRAMNQIRWKLYFIVTGIKRSSEISVIR